MKYFTLLFLIIFINACGSFEKTEGRKIASAKEFIDLHVDGKEQKLFYKGIDVYDVPRDDIAFIIFNPHLTISHRKVLVTKEDTALNLCHTFASTVPGLEKYKQKALAVNGDLKHFGFFTDNTIGLVSGTQQNKFHIQTKAIQNSFYQEIHCALKK